MRIYDKLTMVTTLSFVVIQCVALSGTNFQQWSNIDGTYHLNEEWIFTVENQFRFSEGQGYSYYHADFGFLYTKLADWLDIGFNYRYITSENLQQEWTDQHRPHFNIIVKGSVFDIPINNRMRFEMNSDDDWGNFATFRNKITLNPEYNDKWDFILPVQKKEMEFFHSHNLRPFTSYEFFVDTHTEDLSRHRFSTGVSKKFTGNLLGDIYYLYELNTPFGPKEDIQVLGFNLKFVF